LDLFSSVLIRLFYIKNQKLYCFLSIFFYFLIGLVLVRLSLLWFIFNWIGFGWGFMISGLWNRTEPNSFLNILIGLIDFFHGLVFFVFFLDLIDFLVFLFTSNFNASKTQCQVPRVEIQAYVPTLARFKIELIFNLYGHEALRGPDLFISMNRANGWNASVEGVN
jgi:hypothetical protein